MSSRGKKVGVYIPVDILEALERLRESTRSTYSKLVQESLRMLISERALAECAAVGYVNVLYDHEERGVDAALTDVQHGFLDVVVFSSHIHVDERRCLLSVAVRGHTKRLRELIDSVARISGVLMVKPTLVCL